MFTYVNDMLPTNQYKQQYDYYETLQVHLLILSLGVPFPPLLRIEQYSQKIVIQPNQVKINKVPKKITKLSLLLTFKNK